MDQRLITTAVLGGPDSLEPVVMPMRYEAAMGLRLTHQGKTFWCGTWLGGCGRQIATRIGKRKIPHFAHFPEAAKACHRRNLGETSADHLFVNRDLRSWLREQGMTASDPQLLGDVKGGGRCTGLLLETRDRRKGIAVVFDDRQANEWKRLYAEFAASTRLVYSLYSPDTVSGRLVTAGRQNGLLARCQYVDGVRRLHIGTPMPDGRGVRWSDISECRLTDAGLITPYSAQAKEIRKSPLANSGPVEEKLSPQVSARQKKTDRKKAISLIREAKAQLAGKDRTGARISFLRLKEILDALHDEALKVEAQKIAKNIGNEFLEQGPATYRSAIAQAMNEDLEKRSSAADLLDQAFEAIRCGALNTAIPLQSRAAQLIGSLRAPDTELLRRSRTCAARIEDMRQQVPKRPVRPRVGPAPSNGNAQKPATHSPMIRCSCGWEGLRRPFEAHIEFLASQGRRHTRVS